MFTVQKKQIMSLHVVEDFIAYIIYFTFVNSR